MCAAQCCGMWGCTSKGRSDALVGIDSKSTYLFVKVSCAGITKVPDRTTKACTMTIMHQTRAPCLGAGGGESEGKTANSGVIMYARGKPSRKNLNNPKVPNLCTARG